MASRIRLRAMQNEADRELHTSLVEALRHLEKAEAFCGRVLRLRDEDSQVSAGRVRRYAQDIHRARNLVEGIGSLVNRNVDEEDTRQKVTEARRGKHDT